MSFLQTLDINLVPCKTSFSQNIWMGVKTVIWLGSGSSETTILLVRLCGYIIIIIIIIAIAIVIVIVIITIIYKIY